MTPFTPDTEWQILSPGVLSLPTTGVTIRYDEKYDSYHVVNKHGVAIGACGTLRAAKEFACNRIQGMLEMGIEP